MEQLVETRWRRYGKDLVYVRTHDGVDVGHVDLLAGRVVKAQTGFETHLEECCRRWLAQAPPATAPPKPTPTLAAPPTPAPPPAGPPPPRDFAGNAAGAMVKAKREEVNSQAPVRNLVARVMGVKTEERAWRVGAKGEEKVADQLAKLGPAWHVLHSVEVGDRGSHIDHVVIGPAGVFTLNTKRHPNGRATVGQWKIYVSGQPTDYLRNSKHEADRAQRLLSTACGFAVAVTPVVVFVNLEDFKVKQAPANGVQVVTRRQLVAWLTSLPAATSPATVEAVFEKARFSTTWHD